MHNLLRWKRTKERRRKLGGKSNSQSALSPIPSMMDRRRSTFLDSFHSLHFPPISSSFISLHFFSCRREEGKMRSFHNSPPLLCVRKGDALITGPQSSTSLLVFLLFSFGWRRRLCYSNSKEVVFTFSPFLFGEKGCCLESAFQALFFSPTCLPSRIRQIAHDKKMGSMVGKTRIILEKLPLEYCIYMRTGKYSRCNNLYLFLHPLLRSINSPSPSLFLRERKGVFLLLLLLSISPSRLHQIINFHIHDLPASLPPSLPLP